MTASSSDGVHASGGWNERGLVYTASTFVSAFLLFLVQPMIAKMGAPLFGGSPAVWTTCLVFFQTLLLAGYAYAHASARRLSRRVQVALHLAVVLVPLAVLAPTFPASAAPASGSWPEAALVRALGLSVGLPFFALATNGTLAQRWYAIRFGRDPYFLYAASNGGSLLALLAYPFLIEPNLDLRTQAWMFSLGYIAFVGLATVTMLGAMRRQPTENAATHAASTESEGESVGSSTKGAGPLGWTLRAMVPSVLLVAVSLRVSTDIGSAPLLWIIPLALYIVSFILAFTPWFRRIPRTALAFPCALLIVVLVANPRYFSEAGLWSRSLPLTVLFLGCWVCHADLAAVRPAPGRLTSFFLWIAIGGAVGSALTNLAAPHLFTSIAEYPLSLVLLAIALVMAPGETRLARVKGTLRSRAFVGLLVVLGSLVAAWLWVSTHPLQMGDLRNAHETPLLRQAIVLVGKHLPTVLLATALVGGTIRARRLPAELAISVAFVAAIAPRIAERPGTRIVHSKRSFYGTLTVIDDPSWRYLIHGTILHGGESLSPRQLGATEAPTAFFYHPGSPMAWGLMTAPDGPLAVVGLGTGTLARLIRQEQALTYYELDPMLEPVARSYFTYLPRAKGKVRVEIGDARLRLAETSERYHAIVVDAFSSDAIPVHLLTEEAVRLYLARLLPDGIIYLHVSNRYLDLFPIARSHVKELALFGALRRDVPSPSARARGAMGSDVVALTPSSRAKELLIQGGWTPLDVERRRVQWTDARSSVLPILRMRDGRTF